MPEEAVNSRASHTARVERADAAEQRLKNLAGAISLPENHAHGVVAKLDEQGNVTVYVYGHAVLGDEDSDNQQAVLDTITTTHEVECPDVLEQALKGVLDAELDNMRERARVDVARQIRAAGG